MNPLLGANTHLQQHPQQSPASGHPDSPSGLLPDAVFGHRVVPHPPAAMALRNDLGSNISVLKTLNLRFRCFLAKVHELERRNKILEKQLQQALDANKGCQGGCCDGRAHTQEACVQTGFVGTIPLRPGSLLFHNTNNSARSQASPCVDSPGSVSKSVTNTSEGQERSTNPPPRFLPGTIWSYNHTRKFGPGAERLTSPGVSWVHPDGVGVQIDTITPEIRALYNVLAKVKRERDEYKRRCVCVFGVFTLVGWSSCLPPCVQDLQESEGCQDELALRVQQLKGELVLFKGLMSNNLSELDSKIQEKAMKVDMDICRRIDITARLCDVAQQRNCEDVIQMYQVPGPHECDEPVSTSESDGGVVKEEEHCGSSANQINEEMQRMLNQLRECEFEDDCDSLAWEETEETLLLWEDFPGCTLPPDPTHPPGEDDCLEKVINDTECLFKSREKEYQETIDQIELELATAKSDMNRHLHEYMEMCSMKRGLDVQMETCRRLITQSGDSNPAGPASSDHRESGQRDHDGSSASPPSSSSTGRS
uniref:Intermediate filament family orphan 1b n=1 Tax=Labrus bergylta TaxID=56723 RepID=A0A3Q3ERY2_9LABR